MEYGWSSRATVSSGNARRVNSSRVSIGTSTRLCGGLAETCTRSSAMSNRSFAAAARRTWPQWGGLNVPPSKPMQLIPGPSCELERLVADLDLRALPRAGGAESGVELGVGRSRALDSEADRKS